MLFFVRIKRNSVRLLHRISRSNGTSGNFLPLLRTLFQWTTIIWRMTFSLFVVTSIDAAALFVLLFCVTKSFFSLLIYSCYHSSIIIFIFSSLVELHRRCSYQPLFHTRLVFFCYRCEFACSNSLLQGTATAKWTVIFTVNYSLTKVVNFKRVVTGWRKKNSNNLNGWSVSFIYLLLRVFFFIKKWVTCSLWTLFLSNSVSIWH